MSEITVKVEKDGHANLDSFPYRYGFSGSKDFNLKLNYELKITQAGKGRINVKKAKFKNPETGNIEIGNFVLERNIVVTVIRHDIKTESTISKVIRVLREHKYIIVDDLINYFHPLYLNGDIETHEDLREYLKDYMSSDAPERISEMETTIAQTVKELEEEKVAHEEEKVAHGKTKKELQGKEEELQVKEEEYQKLRMQLNSINDTSFPTRPVTTRPERLLIDVTLEDMISRNRGPVKGVVLHFDDGSTLKNNWDGAETRKQVVSQLIGREVITDVWGTYSASEWFRNVYLV